MLGSRPRICWIRVYSSRVTPCSAAISGVALISALAVAICTRSGPLVSLCFEIAIESCGPIAGGNAAFFRVHHGFSQLQIVRDAQKSPKLAPDGKTAGR